MIQKLIILLEYLLIRHSGFFDQKLYLKNYPDVRKADIDPLMHYLTIGWKEGREPFNQLITFESLKQNYLIEESELDPYSKFLRWKKINSKNVYDKKRNFTTVSMCLLNLIIYILTELNMYEKNNRFFHINQKLIKSLKSRGVKETLRKIKIYLSKGLDNFDSIKFKSSKRIEYSLSSTDFETEIKFSILVPLYNTPVDFLIEMVQSVLDQTYPIWELCIADGSDANYNQLNKIINERFKDPRIKYHRLNENRGIALNTNAAYEMATGDFLVLLDHDDLLTIDALYEVVSVINKNLDCDIIYSDRAIFADKTREIIGFHYLPGFSPDYLRSMNYMSHLIAFSQNIIEQVGFEREDFDGSQDYELLLRCSEKARKIHHIPKVLYLCRASEGSVAQEPSSKLYAYEAGKKAISEHIYRIGYPGKVEFLSDLYSYRIRYQIKPAKVSIIILNKDHIEELDRCLKSILSLSTYSNYDIVVIENNSEQKSTFNYYESLGYESKIRIIIAESKDFNYSALNNFAVQQVDCEFIILLNNDIEVVSPGWIEEMLMFAQRLDVGAVGAKLLYPDNTIQHCGLVIGLGGNIAGNYGHKKPDIETGYMHRLVLPQNYSAVTAACLMVKKQDYLKVGGMDEVNFPVGLNDVDFCLKLRELGLFNVWTPYSKLYHLESFTRGSDMYGKNKIRYSNECNIFREKWHKYFSDGDPFDVVNFKGW